MTSAGGDLVAALRRLKQLGDFPSLPDATISALAKEGRSRTYAAGTTLFNEGDGATAIYIVLDGHVAVVRITEGREYPLHHERPGGTLGEVPVFSGCGYLATAIARVDTVCLVVSAVAAKRLVQNDPGFAAWVIDRLGARIVALVNRFEATGLSTTERIARYIAERARLSSGPRFRLGMSQDQVAQELGTVREVVSRVIKRLIDESVIERHTGGWFTVRDAEKLATMGREPPDDIRVT
jgi:CRP-like cAMP-binding protein